MTNCAADVTIDAVKATSKTCYIGGFMGDGGGTIVCAGTPETVAECEGSFTGQFLKEMLDS